MSDNSLLNSFQVCHVAENQNYYFVCFQNCILCQTKLLQGNELLFNSEMYLCQFIEIHKICLSLCSFSYISVNYEPIIEILIYKPRKHPFHICVFLPSQLHKLITRQKLHYVQTTLNDCTLLTNIMSYNYILFEQPTMRRTSTLTELFTAIVTWYHLAKTFVYYPGTASMYQ